MISLNIPLENICTRSKNTLKPCSIQLDTFKFRNSLCCNCGCSWSVEKKCNFSEIIRLLQLCHFHLLIVNVLCDNGSSFNNDKELISIITLFYNLRTTGESCWFKGIRNGHTFPFIKTLCVGQEKTITTNTMSIIIAHFLSLM